MAQMMENIQARLKGTSTGILLFTFKMISGLILGLTFALNRARNFCLQHLPFCFCNHNCHGLIYA